MSAKVEALVTVMIRPYQGVGEPVPEWEELCRFVTGGKDLDAIQAAVAKLEPVVRQHSWRRIDQVRFDVTALEQLRGFHGHLVRALNDANVKVDFRRRASLRGEPKA